MAVFRQLATEISRKVHCAANQVLGMTRAEIPLKVGQHPLPKMHASGSTHILQHTTVDPMRLGHDLGGEAPRIMRGWTGAIARSRRLYLIRAASCHPWRPLSNPDVLPSCSDPSENLS